MDPHDPLSPRLRTGDTEKHIMDPRDPLSPRLRTGASEFRKILLALDGCATLTHGALVAAEHCRFDAPPDGLRVLRMLGQRRYGETAVSFFTAP
jgi:hypothetical protein